MESKRTVEKPLWDHYPEGTRSALERIITECRNQFPGNRFCQKLYQGELEMADYHRLLKMLFPQVYSSSNTFALAASHCDLRHGPARDYLLKHADEEKTHWVWILEDLTNTGYRGPDLQKEFPHEAAGAYIAFNYYIANRFPIARLAIATMLETLGGAHGREHAEMLCRHLSLNETQTKFLFGHGDTDVGHTKELWETIDACRLGPGDWGWMCFSARTAFKMYVRMYDEVIG